MSFKRPIWKKLWGLNTKQLILNHLLARWKPEVHKKVEYFISYRKQTLIYFSALFAIIVQIILRVDASLTARQINKQHSMRLIARFARAIMTQTAVHFTFDLISADDYYLLTRLSTSQRHILYLKLNYSVWPRRRSIKRRGADVTIGLSRLDCLAELIQISYFDFD